jgi:GAF domain-containing protein
MSSDRRGALEPSEKRAQQFRKLTEVSRALTYAVSLDDVLELAVQRAAELLESQRAVLMLTNADGLLSVRAAFGLDPAVKETFREPRDGERRIERRTRDHVHVLAAAKRFVVGNGAGSFRSSSDCEASHQVMTGKVIR